MHDESNNENSWVNVKPGEDAPQFTSDILEENLRRQASQFASQSFLEEHEIHLSQHAIVNDYEKDERLEISQESFQRGKQQNQSTPIQNFRAFRQRDGTTKN